MGDLKLGLMKEVSDIVSSLDLSNASQKKGEVRSSLTPVLVKYFPELSSSQANSVATVVVHFIYKDFGLMRGELQLITLSDLERFCSSLESERVGQLFAAELAVREGMAKSWNVNARGTLIVQPNQSEELSSTPSDLSEQ